MASCNASTSSAFNAKAGLEFVPAVALGMMCNALVCLAVWLTFSARTTTDRILAIVPPIAAFVASVPYLVLVVLGYNSSDLDAENQIVGSLLIVVLPGLVVAMIVAGLTAMVARSVVGRRRVQAEPARG